MARKSTIEGTTEGLVLSCIVHTPRSGYEIMKTILDASKGETTVSPGVLYPVLHKLERDGFIEGTWEDKPRRRKRYTITDDGSRMLKKWNKEYLSVGALLTRLAKT